MMKTSIIRKTVAILVMFVAFSAFILPTNVYAMEAPHIIDYDQVCHTEINDPAQGRLCGYKDTWYDNFFDAYNNTRFQIGQHAEFKYLWFPIYGWTTKGCTIIDHACTEKNGKWAPVYQNSYNNKYYLGSDYE